MKVCSVPGCGGKHDSRGLCGKHAQRLRRNGDPLIAKFDGGRGAPAERFWRKVLKTETCWLWTAATTKGYGVFWDGDRLVYAHRWSLEQEVGPVPAELDTDHLCRTPLCVRPSHLEPVTRAENANRGARWGSPQEMSVTDLATAETPNPTRPNVA